MYTKYTIYKQGRRMQLQKGCALFFGSGSRIVYFRIMHRVWVILFGFLLMGCATGAKIIDKPIDFDKSRIALTQSYLKQHYGLEQEHITIIPKMIVVHWTAIPTLEGSFNAFKTNTLPSSRDDITSAGNLNVSSQFLIDQDGTIYRLMPETYMARHVIGLNHCAIGIENVGGTKNKPLTKKQLKANIDLITYLKNKYPLDYLIGHYEYTFFEGHPLWLEVDQDYRTIKTDPGKDFMTNLRRATKALNFKPLPK
ncbi:peptidoglycan recognition protein family protein [Croceivirga radicis]|nr:peptidoglycan recognition family protein [Croceivirga radicis]